MEIFIGRQPIFNRNEQIYAYELLYRNGDLNTFPNVDGDQATLDVLVHSFLTIGLDELAGGLPCFINFTENLLMQPIFDTLNPRHVVIEILEDVSLTKEVVEQIRKLKMRGFQIALDDFILDEETIYSHSIFEVTDYIKVDFLLTEPSVRKRIEHIIKTSYPHIRLLAEKVETRQEFEEAIEAGYVFFQGYFFAKPQIVQGQDIPANISQYFRLISMITEEEADITQIADLIEQDVSLSFKLLKLINSTTKKKVRSIKQAVLFIGLTELHKWIYVLTLKETTANNQSPAVNAIITSSLFRAKFCELLAKHERKLNSSEYFLTGMFSQIESLIRRPFRQIMMQLPLPDEVVATIDGAETEFTPCLNLAIAFDHLDWDKIEMLVENIDIPEEQLRIAYLDAMRWANQIQ